MFDMSRRAIMEIKPAYNRETTATLYQASAHCYVTKLGYYSPFWITALLETKTQRHIHSEMGKLKRRYGHIAWTDNSRSLTKAQEWQHGCHVERNKGRNRGKG